MCANCNLFLRCILGSLRLLSLGFMLKLCLQTYQSLYGDTTNVRPVPSYTIKPPYIQQTLNYIQNLPTVDVFADVTVHKGSELFCAWMPQLRQSNSKVRILACDIDVDILKEELYPRLKRMGEEKTIEVYNLDAKDLPIQEGRLGIFVDFPW